MLESRRVPGDHPIQADMNPSRARVYAFEGITPVIDWAT